MDIVVDTWNDLNVMNQLIPYKSQVIITKLPPFKDFVYLSISGFASLVGVSWEGGGG